MGLPTRLGKYHLKERIGQGGMGDVWRAQDEELGRDVAIKLVRTDGVGSQRGEERLRHEARTAASLKHRSIVQIYDFITWEGQTYIVMEIVEGRTLGEILKEDGPIPLVTLLPWLKQITGGLACAHENGIVHRDLKPDNVMIARAAPGAPSHAKILDFGLAKDLNRTNSASVERGNLVGTLAYNVS